MDSVREFLGPQLSGWALSAFVSRRFFEHQLDTQFYYTGYITPMLNKLKDIPLPSPSRRPYTIVPLDKIPLYS